MQSRAGEHALAVVEGDVGVVIDREVRAVDVLGVACRPHAVACPEPVGRVLAGVHP
jgi:hypothetical protein